MIRYSQKANRYDAIFREVEEVLAQGETKFQRYLFFRSKMHGTCIGLDGDIQSCESDQAIYHEALVHPAMMMHPRPEHVLVMGGGEGATVREVLRHSTVRKVTMVDIDKEFVELCRRHVPDWSQGVWDDSRLEVRYQDINEYLGDCDAKFDVVIGDLVDVHDWDTPIANLYGSEFYSRLKLVLNAGAIVATQGGGLVGHDLKDHNHIRLTLGQVFSHVETYAIVIPSFYHLWGFVMASDEFVDSAPEALEKRFSRTVDSRDLELSATGVESLIATFALPMQISEKLS